MKQNNNNKTIFHSDYLTPGYTKEQNEMVSRMLQRLKDKSVSKKFVLNLNCKQTVFKRSCS